MDKYERVYHYLSAKWALDDLENRHIKISVFDRVNDERELRAHCFIGLEEETEDMVKFLNDHFCLLCFARDSTDPHMWREYGDEGRGICLGLDVRKNLLREVEYVDTLRKEVFPPKLIEKMRASRSKSSVRP